MKKPMAWLLSAYRADSHAAWGDWLVSSQQQYEWQRFELPGRHFRWRIRGNPLSWLDLLPETPPDLIVATSMVDLATLKGLHPRLAQVPCLYYFHENQFAYPVTEQQFRSVDPQMVQLYGALAADRVAFNSSFNRESLLNGIDQLLAKMPDCVPPGVSDRIRDKNSICPVPITPIAAAAEKEPQLILWNHRWEYDKAPDLFATAMIELAEHGHDFQLALLGSRPKKSPPPLTRLRKQLPDRILVDGKVAPDHYRELLGKAGIVISTAIHEFQGLAILEAASAGARPLVPDALCYPEQYGDIYRYPAGDINTLVDRLGRWLDGDLPPSVDVSPWYEESLIQSWHNLLSL
ncbi:MAG: DUF3524 domain-containing protein [Candidatus Sedimenticola sp. (ex Thyasira tokunagai)]